MTSYKNHHNTKRNHMVKSKYGGSNRKTNRKTNNHSLIKEFISQMFSLQLTLKMVHWSTKSYQIHINTDLNIDKINPLIDSFVESFLGKNTRKHLKQDIIKNIVIHKINNTSDLNNFIHKIICYLSSLDKLLSPFANGDLISIRDEIISQLNILRYLLSFNMK